MPFSISSEEAREIRDIALEFFKGNNVENDKELKWYKWRIIFIAFIASCDAKHGNLLHLPFSGGSLEQPIKTMAVFAMLQGMKREQIVTETKKAIAKQRRR